MRLKVDDLFCHSCQSYVHPFLDRCLACGEARRSRFDEALGDADGPSLLDDPELLTKGRETIRAYDLIAHRNGVMASGVQAEVAGIIQVPELFDVVARATTYRSYGVGARSFAAGDADLQLRSGAVRLRRAPDGDVLVEIPPAQVVGSTVLQDGSRSLDRWAGVAFGEFRALPEPAVSEGSVLVTFADQDGFAQFSVGNRTGLFASRARPDHYRSLSRWLGILAACDAEARWRKVGAFAYASELGLVARPGTVLTSMQPASGASESAASLPSTPAMSMALGDTATGTATRPQPPAQERSVREALEQLEALRAADLVSQPEYEAKRQEILGRL